MDFDRIGRGDRVMVTRTSQGVVTVSVAIAHRFVTGTLRRHDRWLTEEGGVAVMRWMADAAEVEAVDAGRHAEVIPLARIAS